MVASGRAQGDTVHLGHYLQATTATASISTSHSGSASAVTPTRVLAGGILFAKKGDRVITQRGEEINAEMAQRLTKVIKTALIPLNPTDHARFGNRIPQMIVDADWCWWVAKGWKKTSPHRRPSSYADTTQSNRHP